MTLTRHAQPGFNARNRTANMNSLVSKFSTTDADSEIRRAKGIAEEDGLTDAMWGSQAGFGQLVHGHAFNIPAVPDVRSSETLFLSNNRLTACHVSHSSPRRS
jgi:20S proteasome subunit beta 5